MSEPKLGNASWMTLREFDADTFIEWYISESKAGRMTEERKSESNWGVSAEYLLSCAYDCRMADRARWLMPPLFVTGFLLGYFL